ncbi:hypothetical protein [Rothia nasimurium]|uniref:hypothetical protein n=1 Tax=Rothia nasimurium TaxID=85336 RepID=UPI001F29F7E0|nr:hypothetical protein [Rothia nasimurium]
MAQSAPRPLAHLGPLQQLRAGKLALRLPLLVVGLVGFGASCALLIKAGLGALIITFSVGPLIGWFLPYVTVPLTPRPRPSSGVGTT